jgi:Dihaem cytochrome c
MKWPIESQRPRASDARARPTRAVALISMLSAVVFASACLKPLPEANSTAAQLYVRRCGQCHRAYAPIALSAAMWGVQVDMMEAKMRQYRVPPLTDQERDTILSYLTRNASH